MTRFILESFPRDAAVSFRIASVCAGVATRPFALKVKRLTLEGNDGTMDEDHHLFSSRNGSPLRGRGLAVSGSGESM